VLLPGANGFVPQDDRLHGFFTVKSYMKHYSRLAGLKHTPELDTEIDELISDLGLTDQAGTIVGDLFLKGLSGGQKRRLSIGLEALTNPAVSIILDWIGLDWIGLDWIGLDWIGLDWIGLDWIGLDWICWCALVCFLFSG
jgi:ABC-type Na+ transport system ATPase subunit NatA